MSFEDWKTYKLADVTKWRSGGTPSKSNENYWNGTIPWISAKTLNSNRVSDSVIKISEAGLKNGSRLADIDSILLLVRGSGLFNGIPIAIVKKQVAYNQDIKEIIPDKNHILPEFLLYWFESSTRLLNSKMESTGIGAGKFDTEIIQNLDIKIPNFQIQAKIVEFIKSLDDKIENNLNINQTLEEIARTLFNEMCLPKGDELPAGWRVGKLGEIIKIKHGYAFKGSFFSDIETNHILITPGNFKIGGGFNYSKFKYYNGSVPKDYVMSKNNLIVTMTDLSKEGDTLGYSALVPEIYGKELLHNQRIGKVEFLDNPELKYFCYFLLREKSYRDFVLGSATGTTVRHTSPDRICDYKAKIPSENTIKDFNKIVIPLLEKILTNEQQNQTLKEIRDSLLPKLMSGEIEVNV